MTPLTTKAQHLDDKAQHAALRRAHVLASEMRAKARQAAARSLAEAAEAAEAARAAVLSAPTPAAPVSYPPKG